ncbi:MAG: dipeptide epimerase [Candidatus Aminicenantes bacterium]|nr:MAG: dipeptide epimerase [Candidatus Aminicenantes bacterium]
MVNTLKITSIEIYKVDIELKEPFKIAIMEIATAADVFIKINTNEKEIYGWGEANPFWSITGETQGINLAAAVDIAKLFINKNPLSLEARIQEMESFLVHNTTIKSAFDMALYDIYGKATGLPLYALLGGEKRSFWTDMTLGLGDPDETAHKAKELKDQGFQAIKVKLGTTYKMDVMRIEKIRSLIGDDWPIRVDANQGWDFKTALKVLKTIETMGIEYCEQPTPSWDYESLRKLRESLTVAIMADESLFSHHDALRLATLGCCDLFNIKLAKSGGIYNALKINSIAEAAGIACMVGCMSETRLGLTAAAHLVSARRNIKYADLDGHLLLKEDPIIGGAQYNVGEIILPDTPGHGAEIDPTFLKKFECLTIK